jgi:hypothetical protein
VQLRCAPAAPLFAAIALAAAGCHAERPESPGTPIARRTDGYVSSDACQACHPREHATWHRSYHRRMTQIATPDAVRAAFDGEALEFRGRRFRLSEEERSFWVTEDGGEPRRVVMTTGSHHFQAYWFETGYGRQLALFPMMWKIAERRWLPFNALVLTPPDYPQHEKGGEWNELCIACHSTHGQPRVLDGQPPETQVAEFGIACESCHGPGAEHVLANRNPVRRLALRLGDGPDDTITNPARLPPLRSAQVCGQCHAVQALADPQRWLREGSPYRPGEELFITRVQAHGDDPRSQETRFWPDGRVRVGGREYPGIVESACFASGELTCSSCHRMHQAADDPRPPEEWADDQLEVGMRGDAACLGCHPALRSAEAQRAHSHHEAESSGSRCQACHMPHYAFGLHKATRSHHIAIPTAQETAEAGRPNACNLCHLDRTLAWTAERLAEWYGMPRPELSEREEEVALGVWWPLAGDANPRALAGWHMGYGPAQRASGTDWMAPYLAHLLSDAYEVNRVVAFHALRTLPGFEALEVDYMQWPEGVTQAALEVKRAWIRRSPRDPRARPELLLLEGGTLDAAAALRLSGQRDRRPIYLAE